MYVPPFALPKFTVPLHLKPLLKASTFAELKVASVLKLSAYI